MCAVINITFLFEYNQIQIENKLNQINNIQNKEYISDAIDHQINMLKDERNRDDMQIVYFIDFAYNEGDLFNDRHGEKYHKILNGESNSIYCISGKMFKNYGVDYSVQKHKMTFYKKVKDIYIYYLE